MAQNLEQVPVVDAEETGIPFSSRFALFAGAVVGGCQRSGRVNSLSEAPGTSSFPSGDRCIENRDQVGRAAVAIVQGGQSAM